MDNGNNIVAFKIYLMDDNSAEAEVRRFGQLFMEISFDRLVQKIMEVFPRLSSGAFRIYWIDEDEDSVTISSDDELIIALTSMKSDLKKLFVKVESASHGPPEDENSASHIGIFCDVCGCNIAGFRFKCLMCKDYDLCRSCEKTGIHADHVMLRIPNPMCLDRANISKLAEFVSLLTLRSGHHKKHHAYESGHSDSYKKKKRAEKRESGADTGDEMDEGLHKKHSHKKCRKQGGCPYTTMMNYFSPIHFRSEFDYGDEQGRKTQEEPTHMKHLKSIGATIQKLLDPLGVNVEFEVRPNRENEKGEKKQEDKKEEEKKQEEKRKQEEKPATPPAPSAPPQKEVRFTPPQQTADTANPGVDEITKILANQTMSSSSSADNDGWVSFEELKKEWEEPQPGRSSDAFPKAQKQGEASAPSAQKKTSESSHKAQGTGNLYPNLSVSELSPDVKDILDKMLALGYSNDGNWLGQLLQAKGGNVADALEAMYPKKKK